MSPRPEFDEGRSRAIRQYLVETAAHRKPAGHLFILRKTVIVGSIILGSMTLLGGTAVAATVNKWIALPSAIPGAEPSYGAIPVWPVNEHGQTFGAQGTSPVPPDLIKTQGLNASGVLFDGYILSTDEAEPMPTSPAQAFQQQVDRQRDFPNGRAIPLYESDGTTVIGTFTIGS